MTVRPHPIRTARTANWWYAAGLATVVIATVAAATATAGARVAADRGGDGSFTRSAGTAPSQPVLPDPDNPPAHMAWWP